MSGFQPDFWHWTDFLVLLLLSYIQGKSSLQLQSSYHYQKNQIENNWRLILVLIGKEKDIDMFSHVQICSLVVKNYTYKGFQVMKPFFNGLSNHFLSILMLNKAYCQFLKFLFHWLNYYIEHLSFFSSKCYLW